MRTSVLTGAFICGALWLFVPTLSAQPDRIVGRIDAARKVPLPDSLHPRAQSRYDLGPLDSSRQLGYVTLLLKPSAGGQAALVRLLEEQQDRHSQNYRRWLTPEQFGERFGASPRDYAAVIAWLESEGLRVETRARARNWIAFSGAVRLMEGAFRTRMRRYLIDGKTYFGNATGLSIPAAIADLVGGVRGLDDFWRRDERPQYLTASGVHRLAPDDWATIYDVAPLYQIGIDGAGQRIAILGTSDLDQSHVDTFRGMFGLPASTVEMHLVGPDPGITASANEACLDVEWSGAIARGATIVYVYGSTFNDAAQAAIDQNLAPVMSQSAGTCEPQGARDRRVMAQQANAQGITWVASAGDAGGADCDPHGRFGAPGPASASAGLAVGIPASFPEVTAVGGTEFNEGGGNYWSSSGAALSYIPEMVWNETSAAVGLLASGGGSSIYYPKPAWQAAPGMPNDSTRDIPDLSFSAAVSHDAYAVVNTNGQGGTGGTSASAPSFAGVVALLNHYLASQGFLAQPGLGNINPGLYRLASTTTDVYHDITQGDNIVPCVPGSPDCVNGSLGSSAAAGYDLATGLGSADVYNLVTEWNTPAAATATVLAANPGAINLGDAVQFTAIVTPTSAVPGAPTGSITFTTGATVLGSVPLVNLNGTATATLTVAQPLVPVGSTVVAATYSGDTAFDGSTGVTMVSVRATSPGSAVVVSITPNPAHEGQFARVSLTEVAGVGTRITGWTINGVNDFPLFVGDFGSDILPAYGTLWVGLKTATGVTVPSSRVYVFSGVDADGRQWSTQYTLTLAGSSVPEMVLSSAPASAAGCAVSQQLTLQERNGLSVQLTRFLVNGADWSKMIAQLFGSTILGASGTLQAAICWPDSNPPSTVTYEMDGVDQTGSPVQETLTTSFP